MDFNKSLPEILKEEGRQKLLQTAKDILDGKINTIQGSRLILQYANQADVYEDEAFLPVIGLESETDHLFKKETNILSPAEALKKVNEEEREYIKSTKDSFFDDLRQIIEKYKEDDNE